MCSITTSVHNMKIVPFNINGKYGKPVKSKKKYEPGN